MKPLSFFCLPCCIFTLSAALAADTEKWPIGVIARFDDHGTGMPLQRAVTLGLPVMLLKVPVAANRTDENARKILDLVRKHGMTIVCVLSGFAGESYASIPMRHTSLGRMQARRWTRTIAATVGKR